MPPTSTKMFIIARVSFFFCLQPANTHVQGSAPNLSTVQRTAVFENAHHSTRCHREWCYPHGAITLIGTWKSEHFPQNYTMCWVWLRLNLMHTTTITTSRCDWIRPTVGQGGSLSHFAHSNARRTRDRECIQNKLHGGQCLPRVKVLACERGLLH